MAKHFNPQDIASVKTDISWAPRRNSGNLNAFLLRRVARAQRRARRAL